MTRFFNVLNTPTNALLKILRENVIGTPGLGMLYQHLGVDEKIHKIAQPYFVNLERNGTIAGTCCFCSRPTYNVERNLPAYYIRYFSFQELFRRKNIQRKTISRNSLLRKEINQVLNGEGFGKTVAELFYHYAYVDPRNVRSLVLCHEFGFETVRTYSTLIFNRIKTSDANIKAELLSVEEELMMKDLLADFYKEYTMFSFENIFQGRPYHVIKNKEGKIVAGVQATPDAWNIRSLPGLSGQLLLKSCTYLPYLNRLFNKRYCFIALDGIYIVHGHEKEFECLMENLLAHYKVHSALIVLDVESNLYKTLKSIDLGWVHKLHKEVGGNVICRFSSFSQEEKELFKNQPAYISGIDVT